MAEPTTRLLTSERIVEAFRVVDGRPLKAVYIYRMKDGDYAVVPMGRYGSFEIEVGGYAAQYGSTKEIVETDIWAAQPEARLGFYDFVTTPQCHRT